MLTEALLVVGEWLQLQEYRWKNIKIPLSTCLDTI